jgi:hypothetical protein
MKHDRDSCESSSNNGFDILHGDAYCNLCILENLEEWENISDKIEIKFSLSFNLNEI